MKNKQVIIFRPAAGFKALIAFIKVIIPVLLLVPMIALLILLSSTTAQAKPAVLNDLEQIGSGEMTVFFWTLYQAEYYLGEKDLEIKKPETQNNNKEQSNIPSQRQALRLIYKKNIEAQKLIEATGDQWQHINLSNPAMTTWLKALADIWPNIKPDDEITLYLDDKKHSYFYSKNKQLGIIKDKNFGPAFLAIWLSEQTSEPKLRKNLLNLK